MNRFNLPTIEPIVNAIEEPRASAELSSAIANHPLSKTLGQDFVQMTIDKSKRYGFPADVLLAQIHQESGGAVQAHGDPKLKNQAYGLGQIRQPALNSVNTFLSQHKYPAFPSDPSKLNKEQQVEAMLIYQTQILPKEFKQLANNRGKEFTPTLRDILEAYNRGASNVIDSSKSNGYYSKVISHLSYIPE